MKTKEVIKQYLCSTEEDERLKIINKFMVQLVNETISLIKARNVKTLEGIINVHKQQNERWKQVARLTNLQNDLFKRCISAVITTAKEIEHLY